MKKKLLSMLLCIILSSIMLFSCGEPTEEQPPAEAPPADIGTEEQTTLEYGYDLVPDESLGISEYMIAYKVDQKEFPLEDDGILKIRVSHGSVGPWVGGGCVYPDIQEIELVSSVRTKGYVSRLLYRDEYYDYIGDCFFRYYAPYTRYGSGTTGTALVRGRPVMFYTSDYYEKGKILKFTNEEEYWFSKIELLRFTSDSGILLTFELREIYGDGTVKVVKTANLYYTKDETTIKLSTEPFDN